MSDSRNSSSAEQDTVRPTPITTGETTVVDGSGAVHPALHVDLSKPRYNQSLYWGRARHFFETVNPLNILASNHKLEEAAKMVQMYKERGVVSPGTTEEDLWRSKRLYDSAYHPGTGRRMFIVGRMSFQVYGNMTIIGLMMTFYKHPGAVVFWQLANQSFNATVNYTNRGGDEHITYKKLMVPFAAATGGATASALILNNVAKSLPSLIGRFVPLIAVAVANTINIPLMRQRELKDGIPVCDSEDMKNKVGTSQVTAQRAIGQVTISRIIMAIPGMTIPAFIMHSLEKRPAFKRMPWASAPLQVCLVGLCLVFTTPLCCAIFPQTSSIPVSSLEPQLRESLSQTRPDLTTVYYNKGL